MKRRISLNKVNNCWISITCFRFRVSYYEYWFTDTLSFLLGSRNQTESLLMLLVTHAVKSKYLLWKRPVTNSYIFIFPLRQYPTAEGCCCCFLYFWFPCTFIQTSYCLSEAHTVHVTTFVIREYCLLTVDDLVAGIKYFFKSSRLITKSSFFIILSKSEQTTTLKKAEKSQCNTG